MKLYSQYLFLSLHLYTDIARLGAQVVAGVGFIGAGTIIVTKPQKIKGLTTAAGLWASAIIGLALGAGFYEGGIIATILITLTEIWLSQVEKRIFHNLSKTRFLLSYDNDDTLSCVFNHLHQENIHLLSVEIMQHPQEQSVFSCATLLVNANKDDDSLFSGIQQIPGVGQVRKL